jgi:hypothetical protein
MTLQKEQKKEAETTNVSKNEDKSLVPQMT